VIGWQVLKSLSDAVSPSQLLRSLGTNARDAGEYEEKTRPRRVPGIPPIARRSAAESLLPDGSPYGSEAPRNAE
jgi:hypothetical protein